LRKLVLLGLLAIFALPATAAKRVSVAQLEQALSAEIASHKADLEIARHLGEYELTERLTDETLDRFAATLKLEPRTALALQMLADQSAFQDPPADELPATAFPDTATQERMLDAARGYVVKSWSRLPDFFATRATNRFDDTPSAQVEGGWPVRSGLHRVGQTSREIAYREGHEVTDQPAVAATAQSPETQQELGLNTWGEFGPAMTVVLTDTAKGTLTFHHWERTRAGLAAVYRYSVPRAASHYAVSYCCLRDDPIIPQRQSGGRRDQTARVPILPGTARKPFTETPGYHGSISIDPASGAILRITLEAELNNGDPLLRAATVVEYGRVTIGDRPYICPARSLAFSLEEKGGEPFLLLNETTFTHYRRLGTSMRILADAAVPASASPVVPAPAASNPGATEVVSTSPESAAVASGPTPPQQQPAAEQAAATPPSGQPEAAPTTPETPGAQPAEPEISTTEATGLPSEPSEAPQPPGVAFHLKLTSRLVDVGVVAYDKKGHSVRDLKLENFELFDNGHKQEIRFFTPAEAETTAAPAPDAALPPTTFSNRATETAAPKAANPTVTGATILLLDESHIGWSDLSHARQEMLKFLGGLGPRERVGLYAMTGLGFRVLTEVTTDHAALIARLQKWMPSAQSISQAQEEETRNRQQFNEVQNASDLNSVNGNHTDVPDSVAPIDPQLLTMGSNPARASLVILAEVARHLSTIPGHKNLVWVSSDNVFAEWQDQAVGIDKSPKFIDRFALRAQEAMNDAHAAVYPFDVSQLEGGAITADMQHRNVELTPAAMDNATTAAAGAASAPGASAASGGSRNMAPGRISAEMSQDLHPIQGPIRQVAEATGGRTIRRAGDLSAALNGIVEDGRSAYVLSFAPQGPADGQYHNITVKVSGEHGLTLRYRTGYLFEKEPSTLRERFQQAVWRPLDVSEIAISAKVTAMNPGANIMLNIAAGDLALQQQAGHWMDRLEIFFIERDDAGVRAQVEGQTLGLRLKSSTYQDLLSGGLPFEHVIQLKPGTASLRIVVVDENSGRMGSVTLPAAAVNAAP